MALILPKGIVVNSPEIEGQIERINAEPLDPADIAKFWKVYTTTRRRLLDPTAERLENYWWRIWGSRRRELNGSTVARLFAYISDGQSFVPLRGPANRDEGTTPPLNRTTRHGPGAASATTLHRPSQSRPSTTSSSNVSKTPVALPPILKKYKDPSLPTTTRTARFISPHESEAETNTNSSTRSISPNSHVIVQPPSPDSQNSKGDKKVATAGGSKKKGFVASTAAKKKRPMITRRQSSQSSTEAQNANQSSLEKAPSMLEDARDKGKPASKFQENFSPEHLATQSTRKRPTPKKSRKDREVLNRQNSLNDSSLANPDIREDGGPGPSSKLRSIENRQNALAKNLTEEELNELELQRTLLEDANARVEKKSSRSFASNEQSEGAPDEDLRVSQKSVRSAVNESSQQDLGAIRMLPYDAKGTARVALASAEATGQLELSDSITPLPQLTDAKGRNKGKERDPNEVKQPELFAKRLVPPISSTAATPTPAGDSLARSKSQLTLLLEKDRARSTDKSRDSKKG